MRLKIIYLFISCVLVALLAACEEHEKNTEPAPPATVVKVSGSEFNHVILTQEAANRVGIELVPLKEAVVPTSLNARSAKQVPYSAIIYGLHGETWIYILVKPLTFMRTTVMIDHIDGQLAILSAGPPLNTQVVSVGAAELYGSEYIGNIEP